MHAVDGFRVHELQVLHNLGVYGPISETDKLLVLDRLLVLRYIFWSDLILKADPPVFSGSCPWIGLYETP